MELDGRKPSISAGFTCLVLAASTKAKGMRTTTKEKPPYVFIYLDMLIALARIICYLMFFPN